MKAMIFAAGIGSRLQEITKETPKCLVDIGGLTILEHVVTRLKEAGVSAVAINVHHHADKVVDFVKSRGYFGLEVAFSHETSLLDTGGGLKKLAPFFMQERDFFIHNADIYSDINLLSLLEAHRSQDAVATLAIMSRDSKRGLYFDSQFHLVGWSESSEPPPAQSALYGFCGVSVVSSEIFKYMESADRFSIIRPFMAAALTTHKVLGHTCSGATWADIGTPEKLRKLREQRNIP